MVELNKDTPYFSFRQKTKISEEAILPIAERLK
jgi:hypothetical protein